MANHKDGIQVYTSGISNLVTITAAGLAASTALMQIVGADASNRSWYIWSLIAFFFSLISCFLTMAGLTGQAIEDRPDIDVWNIRLPALISFSLACIGFILLGLGAFSAPEKLVNQNSSKFMLELEGCRAENGVAAERRLRCYDALFDKQVDDTQISNEDLQALTEKDRAWIKVLILKSKDRRTE